MDAVNKVDTVLSNRSIRRHAAARAAVIMESTLENATVNRVPNGMNNLETTSSRSSEAALSEKCHPVMIDEAMNPKDSQNITCDEIFMDALADIDPDDNIFMDADNNIESNEEMFVDAAMELNYEPDYSSDDDDDDDDDLRQKLRQWVIDSGSPLVHTSSLLHMLQPHFPNLPKDARTLLQTRRTYEIQNIAGGQYHHFGIEEGIKIRLNYDNTLHDDNRILLQVNIDGLPLFKSSSESFWPILGFIRKEKNPEPFIIGLWVGKSKPIDVNEFLSGFVNEMKNIEETGITAMGAQYRVNIENFVCDTPARAMIKFTKGHNAYHGCDYCEQTGEYFKHRIIFPDQNAMPRTDVAFDEMACEEHHRGETILKQLNLGLVSNFPLDYMHLICLGVVKRMINIWMTGPLNVRLGSRNLKRLSDRIISIGRFLPREFNRKGRSLSEVARWKATEFRTFLLYTGPVALLGNVPEVVYKHFLMLFVGIAILADINMCRLYCDYVEGLLKSFVEHFKELYGREQAVYNVHCTTHIASHCRRFGPVHNFCSFPFENYLQLIKKLVRKPKYPLQQVIRRIDERLHCTKSTGCQNTSCKHKHKRGPLPYGILDCIQYEQLHYKQYFLSIHQPDNTIIIGNNTYVIKNIIEHENLLKIVCRKYASKESFFTYPFDSSNINIFTVDNVEEALALVSIVDISAKALLLPFNRRYVSFPLLQS